MRFPWSSHIRVAQLTKSMAAVYNLGSGTGVSVRQIMDMMAKVTGIDFTPEVCGRMVL